MSTTTVEAEPLQFERLMSQADRRFFVTACDLRKAQYEADELAPELAEVQGRADRAAERLRVAVVAFTEAKAALRAEAAV